MAFSSLLAAEGSLGFFSSKTMNIKAFIMTDLKINATIYMFDCGK